MKHTRLSRELRYFAENSVRLRLVTSPCIEAESIEDPRRDVDANRVRSRHSTTNNRLNK